MLGAIVEGTPDEEGVELPALLGLDSAGTVEGFDRGEVGSCAVEFVVELSGVIELFGIIELPGVELLGDTIGEDSAETEEARL